MPDFTRRPEICLFHRRAVPFHFLSLIQSRKVQFESAVNVETMVKSSSSTLAQFVAKKRTSSKPGRPTDRPAQQPKKKVAKSASTGPQSKSSQSRNATVSKRVEKGMEKFKKKLLEELSKKRKTTNSGCSAVKAFIKVNYRKPKIKTADEFAEVLLMKLGSEGDEVGVMRVSKVLKEHNKGLLREAKEQVDDEVVVLETNPTAQSQARMPKESESETEEELDDDDSFDDNDEDYLEDDGGAEVRPNRCWLLDCFHIF